MSNTEPSSKPIPRRDVWLTVALAIARENLPSPHTVTVRGDLHSAYIDIANNQHEAQRWADHLGLERDPDVPTTDGKGLILGWGTPLGHRDRGWTWRVYTVIPMPEEPSPLAEQVITAIGAER